MNSPFLERLRSGRLIADGAMGTMLHEAGLGVSECPELWNVAAPERVAAIHRRYVEAGSELLLTNTFGASRIKLAGYGFETRSVEFCRAGVENALSVACGGGSQTLDHDDAHVRARFPRPAPTDDVNVGAGLKPAPSTIFVGASIGPTGKILEPFGDTKPADLTPAFEEQIAACADADILWIESHADIAEARLAVDAARNVGAGLKPVAVTFTFERGARGVRTMMGYTPANIADEFSDVDVLGVNCATVSECAEAAQELRELLPDALLVARPNAGKPQWKNGRTIFPSSPEGFAEEMRPLFEVVNVLGGCCGTTPAHIAAVIRSV